MGGLANSVHYRRLSLGLVIGLLAARSAAQELVVTAATIYTDPVSPALHNQTIVIRDGKIAEIGPAADLPAGIPRISCEECAVFAGFWNSHVHFTGPQWAAAATQPAAKLTAAMQAMLTHSGFTTVVDCASVPENTIALRHRVTSGEVPGPRIYTAGAALYSPHGIPYYLGDLSRSERESLPQPATPNEAVEAVRRNQQLGTDIVKLFTGSYLSPQKIITMPLDIASAAVKEGHRGHQLVFAHPSNAAGVRVAMESGVDVLAHAPDTLSGADSGLVRGLTERHMAMIPTLQLFAGSGNIKGIRQIVAQFRSLGGRLMFGTDTGFLTDYSVAEEYRQLALVGLTMREILAMLTTAPAEEFGVGQETGRLRVGAEADLTILDREPSPERMEDFARVRYAVRAGRVIFDARTR